MKRWIMVRLAGFDIFAWKYFYNWKCYPMFIGSITISMILIPVWVLFDIVQRVCEFVTDAIPKLNPFRLETNPEFYNPETRDAKYEALRSKYGIK